MLREWLWICLIEVAATLDLSVLLPICEDDADCDWPAGDSLLHGMNLMADHINREGFVAGGSNLTLRVVDTACSEIIGREEAVLRAMSKERPFAMIGCGCSDCTEQVAPVMGVAKVPSISYASRSSSLSSRSTYPHFFRTISPDHHLLTAIAKTFLSFGWTTFTALFDQVGEHKQMDRWDDLVISLNVTDPMYGLHGRVMEFHSTALADEIALKIIDTLLRGVIGVMSAELWRFILCSITLAASGAEGFVFATYGNFLDGWLVEDVDSHYCTEAQMSQSFNYGITSVVTSWNDLSSPMPCSTSTEDALATVGDFRAELLRELNLAGLSFYPETSALADALCMAVMAYNSLLELGYQPEDLGNLNKTEFAAVNLLFQNTHFEGVSGLISFPTDGTEDGGGDRIGSFSIRQRVNGQEEHRGTYYVATGVLDLNQTAFRFPNGHTWDSPPEATFPACDDESSDLRIYDYELAACVACSNNSVYIASAEACLCQAGYTSGSEEDKEETTTSLRLRRLNSATSEFLEDEELICLPCAHGTFSSTPGQTACDTCSAGQYQDSTGASTCLQCPRGTYSDVAGSSACTDCPAGTSTNGMGFKSADDCGCPEGTYMQSGICLTCGEGAYCAGFEAEPESEAGYYLYEATEEGLSILTCWKIPEACPGGPMRSCAEGREGLACASCKEGTTASSDGTCRDCNATDNIPFFVICVLVVVLVSARYFGEFWTSIQEGRSSETVLTLATLFSQFLATTQGLQTIAKINVAWHAPLERPLQYASSVSFDMEAIRPGCLGMHGELADYMMSLVIIFGFLGLSVTVHFLHRCWCWMKGGKVDIMPLFMMIGVVMQGLTVMILTTILAPVLCHSHPNGWMTVKAHPSIVCWEGGDHFKMLLLALAAVQVSLVWLVSLAVVTYKFDRAAARGDVNFIHCWSFAFTRVKPHASWYPFFAQARSWLLVLSIVPTAAIVQTTCLTLLLSAWLVLVVSTAPFLSLLTNKMEVAQTFALIQLVGVVPAFMDNGDSELVAAQAGIVFLVVSVLSFPLLFLAMVRHFWSQKRKPFKFFLSHYKEQSGAVARLLKMELKQLSKGDVFLDSDNVADLDAVLDTVSFHVRHFVLLVTDRVFLQPWCLGQLAVSHQQGVLTTPILLGSAEKPSTELIELLPQKAVNIAQLSRFGIGWKHIQQALNWLQQFETEVRLAPQFTLQTMEDLSKRLMNPAMGVGGVGHLPPAQLQHSKETGFLLADSTDMESVAAALILVRLFPACGYPNPPTLLVDGETVPPTNHARLLVICSPRALLQTNILLSVEVARASHMESLPVFLHLDFHMPCAKELEVAAATCGASNSKNILEGLMGLFATTAVRFAPRESMSTIMIQAIAVANRFFGVEPASHLTSMGQTLSRLTTSSKSKKKSDSSRSHNSEAPTMYSSTGMAPASTDLSTSPALETRRVFSTTSQAERLAEEVLGLQGEMHTVVV